MRLPFFNGVILGTIIGVSALAAVSVSNEILGSKGLDAWVTLAPLSEAPATFAIIKISEPEVETRPKIKLQYILNVRVLQPKSLDLAPVLSTLKLLKISDCLAKPCVHIRD